MDNCTLWILLCICLSVFIGSHLFWMYNQMKINDVVQNQIKLLREEIACLRMRKDE